MYTEVISIWPLTSTNAVRDANSIVYSSIHTTMYNVRPDNGVQIMPLGRILGKAGNDSYFFLQCRDQYGNALPQCPFEPRPTVQITASNAAGTITIGSSGSSAPEILDLGNGVYKVNYKTNVADIFSARIAFGSLEVRPLKLDIATATFVSDTDRLFEVQVLPGDPVPQLSQPFGNGLRGALRGDFYSGYIYVSFRDTFNNVWIDISPNGVDTKVYVGQGRHPSGFLCFLDLYFFLPYVIACSYVYCESALPV